MSPAAELMRLSYYKSAFKGRGKVHPQHHGTEQGTLKNVNNFLNTNIYSYLGTSLSKN